MLPRTTKAPRAEGLVADSFVEDFRNPFGVDRIGDVLFITRTGLGIHSLLGRANRLGQAIIRGRMKSPFSHVAVCIKPALWMEAIPGAGIRIISDLETWKNIKNNEYETLVFRPPIEIEQMKRISAATGLAYQLYEDPYNSLIFIKAMRRSVSGLIEDRLFCSEFVVRILQELGFVRDLRPRWTLPIDLFQRLESEGWAQANFDSWSEKFKSPSILEYIDCAGSNDCHKRRQDICRAVAQTLDAGTVVNMDIVVAQNAAIEKLLANSANIRLALAMAQELQARVLEESDKRLRDLSLSNEDIGLKMFEFRQHLVRQPPLS